MSNWQSGFGSPPNFVWSILVGHLTYRSSNFLAKSSWKAQDRLSPTAALPKASVAERPVVLPPATGRPPMSRNRISDFSRGIERCLCKATMAPNRELETLWLCAAENYRYLLTANSASKNAVRGNGTR